MASVRSSDNDTYEWHPEDEVTPGGNTSSTWADHLQTLKGAGYGVLSGIVGAVDAVASDPFEGEYTARNRAGVLDWLGTKQKEAVEGMTPQGRINAQAAILPKEGAANDIFDPEVSARSKIAGTVIGAAPSIVASILGTVAGGPVLGYGIAGAMDAGSVWNDIRETINKKPDDEFRASNDMYAGLRDMGFSEHEARTHMLTEAARNKALLVGTFTAATSRFGAEGIAARALGGKEARVGLARGAARGALGETLEEGVQTAVSGYETQRGKNEIAGERDKPIDWHDLANEVAEAMVGGAGAGGATGAVFRGGARKPADARVADTASPVGPTENAALRPPQAPPTPLSENEQIAATLDAVPTPVPTTAPAPTPQAPVTDNAEIARQLEPLAPPPVVSDVGPTERAALAPNIDPTLGEEDADVGIQEVPSLPVAPILEPRVQEAIGAAPETAIQPPVEPLPAEVTSAPAPELAPVTPEPVAPAPVAEPAPEVAPGAARVLADVAAQKKERKGPRMTPAKQAQVAAGETEVLPKREHENREKQRGYADVATRFRAALADTPHPGETADLKAMRAYVGTLLDKAGVDAKTALPRVTEGVEPALALAKTARALRTGAKDKLAEYLATDLAFRGGAESQAIETRRAQAQTATTAVQEEAKSGEGDVETAGEAAQTASALHEELLGSIDEQRASKRRAEIEAELARRKEIRGREATVKAEEAAKEAVAALERKPARPVVVERPGERLRPKVEGKISLAPRAPVITNGAELKAAVAKVEPKPSEAQKEAGNYAKSHVIYKGLPVTIETPKGGIRAGTAPDGTKWSVKLPASYGYVKGSTGADGSQMDVYVGDHPEAGTIYVVDQKDLTTGKFDEHKALIGFRSRDEALATYRAGFSDNRGFERIAGVTELSAPQFREWLNDPQREPLAPRSVQARLDLMEKVAGKQDVPKTEAEAAEQLKEMRFNENIDVTLRSKVRENVSPAMANFMAARARAAASGKVTLKGPSGTMQVDAPVSFDAALARLRVERLPRLMRNTVNFFQAQISPLIEGTKVYVVSDAEYFALKGDRTSGAYHIRGTIVINRDLAVTENGRPDESVIAHHLIHEGSHGALEDAIEDNPIARRQIEMMRDEMQAYLKRVSPAFADQYGFKDAHEFIAEIMSNPVFQRMASEIPASPQLLRDLGFQERPASMWQSFVSLVRSILNVGSGQVRLLDVALRQAENLFGAAYSRLPADERVKPVIRDISAQAAREAVGDQARAMPLGIRGVGLKMAPFHYIAAQFDNLFTGRPMARIMRAMDSMQVDADAMAKLGHEHAERWLKLEHSDTAEATKAARVVTDITMGNMNPINRANVTFADLLKANPHFGNLKSNKANNYQARANLTRLQAAFMDLKPGTRQQVLDAGNYFRDTQNARTKQLIGKILVLAPNELTPQMITEITDHTAKGTLTEDDRANVGDDNLFKALQNAQELRLIEGMYFPLMRHGTHVVTTFDRVANMHGGTMDGEDIIEFRAANDKDARRKFRAFAEDPANVNTRIEAVAKRRYMPTGRVVSEAEARGQVHDISYRARIQRQGVYFFESARKAEEFRRQNRNEFDRVSEVQPREDARRAGQLTSTHVQAIERAIDRRTDVPEGHREQLKVLLEQASIMQLSGNRIQQRSLPRRNVRGASGDIPRNIMHYAKAASVASAKLKHMDTVREALDDMEEQRKAYRYQNGEAARRQVIAEVRKRAIDASVDAKAPPQFVQDALALSYLYRLFSPAYSVINAMQPWMVTIPTIGGEFGFMRSMAEMTKAYNSVGGRSLAWSGIADTATAARGFTNVTLDTRDLIGSVRNNLKGDPALAAFDEAVARGKIDDGSGLEIGKSVAAGRGAGGRLLARTDRIARQLPQAIEVLNRATTIVATYRLAVASGLTHEQAIEKSFDTMMSTQGDYSIQNTPTAFQHPLGRPMLQFKKYGLMMGTLLYDMGRRLVSPSSTTAERTVAFKQLAGIVSVQMLMAGALGLPGLELLKVGLMVSAALGFTDGYDEWERKMRRLMNEAVGKSWGEMLSSGIVSRAIGVDLSRRVSLADMLTYGEPKEYDRDGIQSYLAGFMFGAPGAMALDWRDGIEKFGKGEVLKGMERMIPAKFLVDFTKAVRGRMDRDITTGEAVAQAIGFRSGRAAEASREVGDQVTASKKRMDAKKDLQQRYIAAKNQGELAAVKREIEKHNAQMVTNSDGVTFKLPLTQRVFTASLDKVRAGKEAKRKALVGD